MPTTATAQSLARLPWAAGGAQRLPAGGRNMVMLVLVLGALLLYGWQLGSKDFWSADEGRSAMVARAIATGHPSPQDVDQLRSLRAPLYYWLVAGSFWVSGAQSEFTARLPNLFAALATVLLIYSLGHRMAGEPVGRTAAVLCGISVLFVWQARLAEPEMWHCLWVVLAYTAIHRAMQGRWWHFACFHAAVGLALMTKELVPLALVLAPLGVFLLWQRQRPAVFGRPAFWLTSPLLLIAVARWYSTASLDAPDSVELSWLAAVASQDGHREPVTYYLTRLPLAFMPLTLLLPWAVALPFRRESTNGDPRPQTAARLAFCWFTVPLVLLLFWPWKQTHHMLPLLPPLSLLSALALLQRPAPRGFWSINLREGFAKLGVWLVPACCATAAPVVAAIGYPDRAWLVLGAAAVLTLVSLAARVAANWSRRFGFEVMLVELVATLLIVCGYLVPEFNADKSHKPFLQMVGRIVPNDAQLAALHVGPHDLFYLNRPVDVLQRIDDWQASPHRAAYVIVPRRRLESVPVESYAVVERSNLAGNSEMVLVQSTQHTVARTELKSQGRGR